MKTFSRLFIKFPIFPLIALMAFLGIIGTANAEDKNVGASSGINSDRKANCKSGGGTSTTAGNTITCTLQGDEGTATVTCVNGGKCLCTGSACDEFGGGDAIDRITGPRNLRDRFKGAMSGGKAPSQLAPPKPLTRFEKLKRGRLNAGRAPSQLAPPRAPATTPAQRARGRYMGRQGFAPQTR
jgi:hypothetical protein